VLVVEDEALVAMLVEDALLDAGFDVIGPAATVEEAIAAWAADTSRHPILSHLPTRFGFFRLMPSFVLARVIRASLSAWQRSRQRCICIISSMILSTQRGGIGIVWCCQMVMVRCCCIPFYT
jgi:DNA-binding NarL/FixJ family response regulator